MVNEPKRPDYPRFTYDRQDRPTDFFRMLTLDDFDFALPPELIAQHPAPERTASRLLHVDGDALHDRRFADLPQLIEPGDLLVFNDTRVIKARLFGRKESADRSR